MNDEPRSEGSRASAPPNPLDDPSIQVPGRLLTVEVLLALMARQHPQRAAMFAEAQTMLSRIQEQFQAELEDAGKQRLAQMFEVSRAWLAKLESESGG